MKPTKYQLAMTKLHNLIESGEIIPDIENENDGVIAGHSKDGLITFSKDNGYHRIIVTKENGNPFIQWNFRVEDEYKLYILTLVREFNISDMKRNMNDEIRLYSRNKKACGIPVPNIGKNRFVILRMAV